MLVFPQVFFRATSNGIFWKCNNVLCLPSVHLHIFVLNKGYEISSIDINAVDDMEFIIHVFLSHETMRSNTYIKYEKSIRNTG